MVAAIKKQRDSNLELYRVITMLLIVAHHYVVNSGLWELIADAPLASNTVFLHLFGAWGKTGINCFVLITGYFMCKSEITLKKYTKLLLEVEFYRIVSYLIFFLSGYEPFSLKGLFAAVWPFTNVAQNFTGCFLLFYLFIPFLNILIKNMTQRQHLSLAVLTLFVYTVLGTVPKIDVIMNYVSWFIVLYLLASYIRLYPIEIFNSVKFTAFLTVTTIIISIISVIGIIIVNEKIGFTVSSHYFLSDSNRIMAVLVGLSSFLLFKNLKIKHSKIINAMGASTFGVLLIHSTSSAMRRWLWVDTLKNTKMLNSPWLYVHAILSVLGIFIVATVIDRLRVRFIETPIFKLWDKKFSK